VIILADTSVWIGFWRQGSPRFARALVEDQIVVHPLVRGELALGLVPRREEALRYLDKFRRPRVAEHAEVLGLIERTPLWGRGIGWVDAHLLASALLDHIQLWTIDQRLLRVAHDLGVAP
jgi:predicted nucleic acid-binding protein